MPGRWKSIWPWARAVWMVTGAATGALLAYHVYLLILIMLDVTTGWEHGPYSDYLMLTTLFITVVFGFTWHLLWTARTTFVARFHLSILDAMATLRSHLEDEGLEYSEKESEDGHVLDIDIWVGKVFVEVVAVSDEVDVVVGLRKHKKMLPEFERFLESVGTAMEKAEGES